MRILKWFRDAIFNGFAIRFRKGIVVIRLADALKYGVPTVAYIEFKKLIKS